MRKYLLLALSLVFVFALGACQEEYSTCENNADLGTIYNLDQIQEKPVTIKVWLDNDDYADALIAAFEAENPNITVIYENVGSVDTRAKLELQGPSGTAADVVVFPHDHIGKALQSGLLYPLPADLAAEVQSRHIESAVGTATTCYDLTNNTTVACNGSNEYVFGTPLSGESVALFYNQDLLTQLYNGGDNSIGLTSDAPATTMESIISTAELYNDYSDPNNLQLFFALDVGNAYDTHFIPTSFGYELFGPDHTDKTAPNFNSTEMINALTWIQENLRPAMDVGSGTLGGESNRTLFEEGLLPYIIDGPWSIERYTDADLNFGITKIPTINGVQPITFSGVQMAAVYKGTKEPTAAFKFLEFMQSDEGLGIMYDTVGKLPTLKDVSAIEGVSDDVYLQGIQEQLAYSQPMPIIPEMGFFWATAGGMYADNWNLIDTPEKIANDAQAGYTGLSGLGS